MAWKNSLMKKEIRGLATRLIGTFRIARNSINQTVRCDQNPLSSKTLSPTLSLYTLSLSLSLTTLLAGPQKSLRIFVKPVKQFFLPVDLIASILGARLWILPAIIFGIFLFSFDECLSIYLGLNSVHLIFFFVILILYSCVHIS